MKREYMSCNVYEATQQRLRLIFEEFDNIYVSFSGGKDSSLLLNLTLDFRRKYYPEKKIGVFHQDFEAQYTVTTEFIERTFERIKGEVEPYWVCLPMATRTALSSYQMYWYPWDDTKEEAWVRPMPQHEYVINLKNNPMTTYRYRMHQEDLAKQFGRWYRISHGDKKTVCLLGMRADESLQRYSGFLNKKYGYKGECWVSNEFKNVWCASPLYDWTLSDVWHANFLFHYDYNRLYDLYYMAGLKVSQMRVASPFNDYSKDSLNLYRVIDPEIWTKLVGRPHLGELYALPAGHAAAAPAQQLRPEIPNLHHLLAPHGRRIGRARHPRAHREGLQHPPQRRFQLYAQPEVPRGLHRQDPGQHRRHSLHKGHPQLEAHVLLHPEKRPQLPLHGLWPDPGTAALYRCHHEEVQQSRGDGG